MDPSQARNQDPGAPDSIGGPSAGHTPLIDSMTRDNRLTRTRRGNPIVPPDPGSAGSRALAWILVITFAGLTIAWQNLPLDLQNKFIGAPPPEPIVQTADQPAPSAGADMIAKVYLRTRTFLEADPTAIDRIVDQVDQFSGTQADEIRTAIVAAELQSPEQGVERLDALQLQLLTTPAEDSNASIDSGAGDDAEPSESATASRDLLLDDIDAIRAIYADGPETLTADERDYVASRYGRMGEYAMSFGQSKDQREAIIGSPWPIIGLGIGAIMVLGLGLIGGFGLLAFGIVWYASPKRRMRGEKPEPGGSVMLETYGVFVALFALLSIGLSIASVHAPKSALPMIETVSLPAHWLLMLTVLWPLLRGMPLGQWRRAMGVHKGQGFFTEVGCGILAYLASVPLYAVGVGITMVLMLIWEAIKMSAGQPIEAGPPTNPVIEILGSGDPFVVIMMFALATIWAPVTEELIFRGALFRHFRGRMHWIAAALLSGILFAFMHAYGPLMVTPLIVLGFMFAFMREWRGSIIAPMTAHFLHNFTLMSLMIAALSIIG